MAAQAHRLLIDGDAVGKDGALGDDARFVHILALEHALELLAEAVVIRLDRFGRVGFDLGDERLDRDKAALHVLAELLPLAQAHAVIFRERLVHEGDESGAQRVLIGLGLFDREHVRKAGDGERGHVVLKAVLGGDGIDRVEIGAQQRFVDADDRISRLRGIDREEHIDLAAADVLLHGGLDRLLGKEKAARQADGDVQIAVVDAFELGGDVQSLHRALGRAVAGHAQNFHNFILITAYAVQHRATLCVGKFALKCEFQRMTL